MLGQKAENLPAAVTARLVTTPTKCARYGALAWISLFMLSVPIDTPFSAAADQLADSAASAAAWRNTPPCPAPVTATRTPLGPLATNTPTMA